MPWWYRVFHTHVAGVVLLAAMLLPDISAECDVKRSWDQVKDILSSHQHISRGVEQCASSLEELSTRINALRSERVVIRDSESVDTGEADQQRWETLFGDLVHDLELDPEGTLFGTQESTWSGYVE